MVASRAGAGRPRPALVAVAHPPTKPGRRGWPWWAAVGTITASVIAFSFVLAIIPGEVVGQNRKPADWPMRRWLFDGAPDVRQRPTSLFSRSLVLPDEDFVSEDDKAREEMLRTRVLRGRDLRFAVLDRADLRKADLTGARLQGASLRRAQMQGASLGRAQMQGASLDEAQMQGASLVEAQMQGASLDEAQLQGALLFQAQMQGASLVDAKMQGARLALAQMQDASLILLCHNLFARVCCFCRQQGQRGSARMRSTVRRRRMLAIECGTCRSSRAGTARLEASG